MAKHNPTTSEAIRHAEWLRDAMIASKDARKFAVDNYELTHLEPIEDLHLLERARNFHDKNTVGGGEIIDALMDAMRFHIRPSELRDLEMKAEIGKLEREIARLNKENETMKSQVAAWRGLYEARISPAQDSDDDCED